MCGVKVLLWNILPKSSLSYVFRNINITHKSVCSTSLAGWDVHDFINIEMCFLLKNQNQSELLPLYGLDSFWPEASPCEHQGVLCHTGTHLLELTENSCEFHVWETIQGQRMRRLLYVQVFSSRSGEIRAVSPRVYVPFHLHVTVNQDTLSPSVLLTLFQGVWVSNDQHSQSIQMHSHESPIITNASLPNSKHLPTCSSLSPLFHVWRSPELELFQYRYQYRKIPPILPKFWYRIGKYASLCTHHIPLWLMLVRS